MPAYIAQGCIALVHPTWCTGGGTSSEAVVGQGGALHSAPGAACTACCC